MTRYVVCLGMLAGAIGVPAGAQTITAEQVLEKVRSAYGSLKAVHLAAEREETTYLQGRPLIASSECELAGAPGNRYYARFKLPDTEAIVVSDGSNMWRALVSKKQWTKVSAAAIDSGGEEDESANASANDLHGVMQGVLLHHFWSLARTAREAVVVKEEDFKLGHAKLHGYLVRAHNDQSAFELLVDRQSFLVVRAKEKQTTPQGLLDVVTTVKQLELDQAVNDSLFVFEPKRGWTEVEMLALPGEQRMLLTGERAANFALKTLDGEAVALADLQGRVVVLDFWATWCGPCREELPLIEKLRTEFGDAVQFYGVNDEDSSTVKKFVKEKNIHTPVLLDSRHEVHMRYGVRAIPSLLIVGRDGVIRQHFIGSRSEPVLREAIQSVVKDKA
jgi:cytochrome c biogenesis protein CcmG/thiol:disulfide interchange protein DsbE